MWVSATSPSLECCQHTWEPPFSICKECDYGACLFSLGILGFVLVLTGLGTCVKQIPRVPLDRTLLPRKTLRVWTLSTCSQLAAHLPTAVNVAVQVCLWEVQCLGQVATEMKLLPHLGVACRLWGAQGVSSVTS